LHRAQQQYDEGEKDDPAHGAPPLGWAVNTIKLDTLTSVERHNKK
jgi:hypothetical protein